MAISTEDRLEFLKQALPLLQEEGAARAEAILTAFSDLTEELPETAPFQGATGAPPPTHGAPLPTDS